MKKFIMYSVASWLLFSASLAHSAPLAPGHGVQFKLDGMLSPAAGNTSFLSPGLGDGLFPAGLDVAGQAEEYEYPAGQAFFAGTVVAANNSGVNPVMHFFANGAAGNHLQGPAGVARPAAGNAGAGQQPVPLSPVPLPGAAWLFLTGYLGLLGLNRRKHTKDHQHRVKGS